MLNKLLNYNAETGAITWAVNRGRVKAGDSAGYFHKKDGYFYIKIRPNRYPAHRIAWFLYHGKWPDNVIDHINGNGSDNRISNLREATVSENAHNMRRNKNNTSGYKGVCFDKVNGKWMAYVKFNGNFINLGRFTTKEDAFLAACSGRERLHKEFHNHGLD